METRVAVISIIVENAAENRASVEALNGLLSDCGEYIVGRMGIPYRTKGISLISVAIDAPNDVINTLTGKLGRLPGVNAKTNYAKL